MKKIKTPLIYFASLTLLLLITGPAKGTELFLSDSTQQTKTLSHSVFLSTGYGDNLILGSTISKPQSFFYGALTYGFKNEFFLSASSFYLPDFTEIPAYNVFSANYSHAFNSWFDLSLSVSGFSSHSALSDTLFGSFLYGDLTFGLDWRFIYTKVSVSRILSGTGSTYTQVRNSKYFQTPDFFSGKLNVSFDPYCNFLLGSLTRITTSDGTSIGVDSPVWTGGGAGSGAGGGNGSGSGSGSTGTLPSTSSTVFFGLMEVDFGLPIALNAGKITVEAEPGYVLPMFTDPLIPSPKGFSLMFNFYIRIF